MTFRYFSQAATCPPVYHTRRRLHTVPLIAESQAGKLWIPIFIVFGLTRPGIEPESTVSVADALSTRPLIGYGTELCNLVQNWTHLNSTFIWVQLNKRLNNTRHIVLMYVIINKERTERLRRNYYVFQPSSHPILLGNLPITVIRMKANSISMFPASCFVLHQHIPPS